MSEAEEFLGLTPGNIPARPSDVRISRKLIMIILAWIAGLLIASHDPSAAAYILLFPFGLWGIVIGLLDGDISEYAILAIGWLLYIALTITVLAVRSKKWFYIWWIILTVLLLLNGAGCHAMLKSLSEIH